MPVPLLPFTPFQQLLRQWEEFCPQNSAQVMLLDGTLDMDIVEGAWQSTLRDLGLGRVHVNVEEGGYSHEIWSGDPPPPLVSQQAGDVDILRYLETELGRAFAAQPALPYRAFILQRATDCYLGIVYQQWVADSVSVRLLMREWFLRIFHPSKARRKLVDLPRPRIAGGPSLGRSPVQLYRAGKYVWHWMRHAKELTTFAPDDDARGVELRQFSLGSTSLDDLLMVTRAEGCTLNDLLISALACSLDQILAPSLNRRITTAITTSIDLRPYLAGDLSETFGSLLAYVPVLCHLPAVNKLDLAQEVARQTRQLKDPDKIAQFLLLPRVLTWLAKDKTPTQTVEFYARQGAISASVANVNLNKGWPALYHPSPLKQYLRVATPSPTMPLSVSASTLGDQLDIVLSSQRATLDSDKAAQIAEDFAGVLRSLVQLKNHEKRSNNA